MVNRKLDMDEVRFELDGIVAVMAIVTEGLCGDIVVPGCHSKEDTIALERNCARRVTALYEPALNCIYNSLRSLLERVEEATNS